MSAKEVNIGKIAKLGDLCYGIAFKAQKIAGVVDFELDYIFFGGNAVYFLEQLLKIGFSHVARGGKLAEIKVACQKFIMYQLHGRCNF